MKRCSIPTSLVFNTLAAASFVIPSILHVIKSQASLDPTIGPVILIVTPTRELADQIEDQSKSFMQGKKSPRDENSSVPY